MLQLSCFEKVRLDRLLLHDIAIVEAPHPYILIILTNLDEGTKQDIGLFESISLLVEEYSQSRGEG